MELAHAMRGLMVRGLFESLKEEVEVVEKWAEYPEVGECISILRSVANDATFAIRHYGETRINREIEKFSEARNALRSAAFECSAEAERKGY